tara:strand:- start:17234 stop:17962 length:729 start_codon:yes stop_codon:yes gene_type:complete
MAKADHAPHRAKAHRMAKSGMIVHKRGSPPPAAAGSMALAVPPEMVSVLKPQKAALRKVVEALGELIVSAREDGRVGGFSVMVDAEGRPRVASLPVGSEAAEGQSEQKERDRAFAGARMRGRIRAAEILGQDDMLSAEELANRLGLSRVTVNDRRQRNELLGLDGAKRGFKFPDWQVDEDGQPIEELPKLFELLGPSPWGVYRFLTQSHDALGGRTAKDALQEGETERVLEAAESLARGDFA